MKSFDDKKTVSGSAERIKLLLSRWGAAASRKALAVLLAASMMVTLAVPAAAAGDSTHKQEVVYVNMDPSGKPTGIYVVNVCDPTDGKIVDYGNYTSVRNLTTTDKIEYSDGKVSITTDAETVYYEGVMASAELPWLVDVGYTLDGREVSSGELAGSSGRLVITITIKKNPAASGNFFDNYAIQAAVTLDNSLCRNIAADGATIANAGGSKQLSFIVLPGTETTLKVSADVTDFEMDAISLNGVAMSLDLDIGDFNTDSLSGMTDGITELDDGAKELDSGAADLYSGAGKLKDGTKEFADGMDELYDGMADYVSGTSKFSSGAAELDDGMEELYSGAKKLAGSGSSIMAGAKQLVNSLFASVSEQMEAGGITLPETLTMDNYVAVLGALAGVTDDARAAAKQQLTAGLEAQGQTLTDAQLSAAFVLASSLLSTSDSAGEAFTDALTMMGVAGTVGAVSGQMAASGAGPLGLSYVNDYLNTLVVASAAAQGMTITADQVTDEQRAAVYASLVQGYTEQGVTENEAALMISLSCYLMAADETGELTFSAAGTSAAEMLVTTEKVNKAFAADQETAASAEKTVLTQMVTESDEYQSGSAELTAVKSQLDSIKAFYDGLKEYTDGVSSLSAGLKKMCSGTGSIASGAASLLSGAKKLKSAVGELAKGAVELDDGMGELKDGIAELKNGTAEFSNGTGEFKSETDGVDIDSLSSLAGLLNGDIEVGSFTSPENTDVTAVQFVMQTEAIKKADDGRQTNDNTDVELSFWQRLLALFK